MIEVDQFLKGLDTLGGGWLAIIVLGLIAGFVASSVTSEHKKLGLVSTTLTGIAGAIVATKLSEVFGISIRSPGWRFLAAIGGAILLLWLLGLAKEKKRLQR